MLEENSRVLEQDESINVIHLKARDWEIFIETLENPPEPNEALKRAWADYHETTNGR